jgi:hypothetical protein
VKSNWGSCLLRAWAFVGSNCNSEWKTYLYHSMQTSWAVSFFCYVCIEGSQKCTKCPHYPSVCNDEGSPQEIWIKFCTSWAQFKLLQETCTKKIRLTFFAQYIFSTSVPGTWLHQNC